jgi:uncharacterized protein YccT (UPF0319 family)
MELEQLSIALMISYGATTAVATMYKMSTEVDIISLWRLPKSSTTPLSKNKNSLSLRYMFLHMIPVIISIKTEHMG